MYIRNIKILGYIYCKFQVLDISLEISTYQKIFKTMSQKLYYEINVLVAWLKGPVPLLVSD